MAPHPAHARRSPRRSGFTLIELLIVLAIITVLLSISWVVYGAALENARISATRATIRQLDSALQERLTAFEHVNLKSQAQGLKFAYDANRPMGDPALPLELAEILVRKDRFKAAFPQREEDLWGLNGAADPAPNFLDDSPLLRRMWDPSIPGWRTTSWKGRDGASTAGAREAAESSELLYVILTDGTVFGGTPLPIDRVNSRHVGDTDGDGNLEFLDDWGQPLRFYNWTTSLTRPIAGSAIDLATFRSTATVLMPGIPVPTVPSLPPDLFSHRLNQDADDPTGALSAGMSAPTNFFNSSFSLGATSAQPFTEDFYHALDTYSLPLIMSAGPDSRSGLNEPTAAGRDRLALPTGDNDQLFDNITNRQP